MDMKLLVLKEDEYILFMHFLNICNNVPKQFNKTNKKKSDKRLIADQISECRDLTGAFHPIDSIYHIELNLMNSQEKLPRMKHYQEQLQRQYEQDRNALKRKEWERRNQEVQQDEDLFASGFNLFGEPYKTSKGDALANRLQNTLGNYDEMKDLLTNHSNQSHLVGIPKNSVPQTPVEISDQNFFPEQRNRVAQCHQASSHSSSLMPPPSGLGPISTLGHEGTRKSRTDWPPGGHNPTCTQSSQANSQPSRPKHSVSHDLSQIRYEDLYNCQNDQHKSVSVDEPAPATSSVHSRRHNHSKTLSGEHSYKENSHSKSPVDLDFSVHGSVSPLPSTSLLLAGNGLSSQNFPPGLHSKTNMLQQKPTAYVRPMDGQDQVPNDSPELKPPTEIEDGYNSQPFGAILDGKVNVPVSKNKLPKLSIPQTNEVSADPNHI
ncbi:unnamed protein product [Ranitomeya imitator]|uniref:AF4/FMR2 family member 2 n=1 Tax=Ranitomeya imitator TaxID=111125 RepID=A0ABN9MRH5_9NEOB|nr:unnamed protein product [Ranitomeya imitator]